MEIGKQMEIFNGEGFSKEDLDAISQTTTLKLIETIQKNLIEFNKKNDPLKQEAKVRAGLIKMIINENYKKNYDGISLYTYDELLSYLSKNGKGEEKYNNAKDAINKYALGGNIFIIANEESSSSNDRRGEKDIYMMNYDKKSFIEINIGNITFIYDIYI